MPNIEIHGTMERLEPSLMEGMKLVKHLYETLKDTGLLDEVVFTVFPTKCIGVDKSGRFSDQPFLRIVCTDADGMNIGTIKEKLVPVAKRFGMDIEICRLSEFIPKP